MPTLALVVSLEAINLTTFVVIGPIRAAPFQQAEADHDVVEQEDELTSNTRLTREIHLLTTGLHRRVVDRDRPAGPLTSTRPRRRGGVG